MENIHFEKKQLMQQWQGTLISVQRRDEALQDWLLNCVDIFFPCNVKAVQDAILEQQQQDLTIENEIDGYRKDIIKEQLKNEQLTAILKKVLKGEKDSVDKAIHKATNEVKELENEMLVKL
eukprot:scaffold673554_cov75-Prasinocladus_malaysianus.AAC.1